MSSIKKNKVFLVQGLTVYAMIAIYNSKRNKTANGETNAQIKYNFKLFRRYDY